MMSEGKPIDLHDPIYITHISRVSKFQRAMSSRSIWPLAGLDFVPLATFEQPFVDVLHVQVLAGFCLEISSWNIIILRGLRYSER